MFDLRRSYRLEGCLKITEAVRIRFCNLNKVIIDTV